MVGSSETSWTPELEEFCCNYMGVQFTLCRKGHKVKDEKMRANGHCGDSATDGHEYLYIPCPSDALSSGAVRLHRVHVTKERPSNIVVDSCDTSCSLARPIKLWVLTEWCVVRVDYHLAMQRVR